MKRKGTILTREKALEFSSGVLTEEATSGFLGMLPVFGREKYKGQVELTEAVKEAEELRTQLNMGRKNKFSYSREYSPYSGRLADRKGIGRILGLEGNPPETELMFRRELAPLHMRPHEPPGSFNYEDLTEKQAEKELGRVLQGIEENKFLESMSIGPSEDWTEAEQKEIQRLEQTKNLRSWIKVKKAQLYNKRK